ncbi:MAG: MFS transporter [Planctomycetia bacterium]|nr:MFS transporter [Planctomycetia bacterium]
MFNLAKTFKSGSTYKSFFLSILTVGLAIGLYKGVIDNYFAEVVHMSAFDKGVSEFFRELPGLLLVVILAALYAMSAERIYKIGAVVMLVGMTLQAIIPPSRTLVILVTFIFSTGEHMQLGMRNTLSLNFAREEHGGSALGYQNAIYQIGTLIGFLTVCVVFLCHKSTSNLYNLIFAASAAFVLLSFLSLAKMRGRSEADATTRRIYFRKKYHKYYMLEIFYGARKQIFFTFGPYALVLFYHANALTISLLFAISAITSFFAAPLIGKLIDHIGYKTVMVADTIILVVVCFFYGFAHHLFPMHFAFIVCCVNYVLDAIISLASMATYVYVQDLSDNQYEIKATLTTGLSLNHLITILIALFGGWIWKVAGIETLFTISAILGLCNSAYAATIKVPKHAKDQLEPSVSNLESQN